MNRIQQLTRAIDQNTTRLATLKRINSAKDDPAGVIRAGLLRQQIVAAQSASSGITRANALLSTADSATSEILSNLQAARSLISEVATGSLSAAEIADKQAEVDTILKAIDGLAKTEFAGDRLLDGSVGGQNISVTGVDSQKILDVDVVSKTSTTDVTVNINVTQQATQAYDQYEDGKLDEDTTLSVTGPKGTATISLNDNDKTQDIEDAFNAVKDITGITATRKNNNDVDFSTTAYGSSAVIQISVISGEFDTDSGGSTAGTDAVATINGNQYTADGNTFSVNDSNISLVVDLNPSASGTLAPLVVSGGGLEFVIGASPTNTATIILPDLRTSNLGGSTGQVASILSGGANTLTGGKADEALQIIDDAITDVTRSLVQIGNFQKYTLDSASRVLDVIIENTSSALSEIEDVDIALETALLARNQLMKQTAMESLSISTLNSFDVLSLLTSAV